MNDDYQILEFTDSEAFRTWLDEHHGILNGVWLKLHKKKSGLQSISYAEALDVALCYGWIDGLKRSFDERSYVQKFTPRRSRSLWSKRNIEHITRLTQAGLMMPAGLKEVEEAQADGRWDAAYDAPSTMEIPETFLAELKLHPKAQAKFDAMAKSARYSIGWQLQTAKKEATRLARTEKIIQNLEEN